MNEPTGTRSGDALSTHVGSVDDPDGVVSIIGDVSYPLDKAITGIDQPQTWCSFPVKTKLEYQRLALFDTYIGNDVRDLKNEKGIEVEHIYLSWQSYVNDKGEVIEGPSAILISPNKRAYRIVAKYLILQVLKFGQALGGFPLNPPARIRCVDKVLDSGNRTYQLELVEQ